MIDQRNLDTIAVKLYKEFYEKHGDLLGSKKVQDRLDYWHQATRYVEEGLRKYKY